MPARKPARRATEDDTSVKVLCAVCSEFFQTPRQCLELGDWNVCLACLRAESDRTLAILRARGITI